MLGSLARFPLLLYSEKIPIFALLSGFRPTPLRGSSKYGPAGRCSEFSLRSLGLPPEIAKSVANWGNLAITKKTWCTYKTAETMLKKCALEKAAIS